MDWDVLTGRIGRPASSRLRELARELEMLPIDAGSSQSPLSPLLGDLALAVGAAATTSFRPTMNARTWGLEFKSYWSARGTPREQQASLQRYEDLVRSGRAGWAFDPRLPELGQRNRVLGSGDLAPHVHRLRQTGRSVGTAQEFQETVRVLVCDGPRLLGFVAGFGPDPFDAQSKLCFTALMPALKRVLRADRLDRDRLFWSEVASTALETLLEPAFVVDGSGAIKHANVAGARWLRSNRGGRERVRRASEGSASDGVRRPLPRGNGAIVLLRTHPLAAPNERVERAHDAWDLTPRQREVLGMLAGGATNKAIAEALGRSVGSVELHVAGILRRAGCTNRGELLAKFYALE